MSAETTHTRSRAARIAGVLVVLFLAWFFTGIMGLVVAAIGLAANELVGPRWVATAAAGALGVAAVATLLESSAVNIAFTTQRPIASDAGKVAAALALAALSAFVARERQTNRGES